MEGVRNAMAPAGLTAAIVQMENALPAMARVMCKKFYRFSLCKHYNGLEYAFQEIYKAPLTSQGKWISAYQKRKGFIL